jgi:hypothetical protein
MLLSGLILGLLAIGIIAHPIDHDHSSFVRASVQPRGATSTQSGVQSCHATDHGAYASYNVEIYIPYVESSCDNTYNILDNGYDITNWQCVESDGNTELYFNGPLDEEVKLNGALLTAFPNIAGGFNCPGH